MLISALVNVPILIPTENTRKPKFYVNIAQKWLNLILPYETVFTLTYIAESQSHLVIID